MARDAFRAVPLFFHSADVVRQLDWQPPVDVYRTRYGWVVKVDLAGVRPSDVEWSVRERSLTVRGMRRDCLHEEGCHHYRMEITYSRFERTIEVPSDLTKAVVATEFQDGMLLIRIREAEA